MPGLGGYEKLGMGIFLQWNNGMYGFVLLRYLLFAKIRGWSVG